MKFKLIFKIARSMLFARLKQTTVAAVGVTFSIMMFITLLSFMGGLNKMLDSLILNRTPHVRLYNEVLPSEIQPINRSDEYADSYNTVRSIKPKAELDEIRNSIAILKSLREDERVYGVAPKTTLPIFYNTGTINLTGVISGVDVVQERRLFTFDDYVVKGNAIDLKNIPNSIILGKAAARIMLVDLGDQIQITTSTGSRFPLKVVGFFQSGIEDIDKSQSYCSLATTQKMMGKTDAYMTDIQIKLVDRTNALAISNEYAEKFDVEAVDVETANAQFETGTTIRNLISYAVGVTLLIVAGFGIYNILNMMIYEKMDSIAILKATGFSGKDVNRIFIVIALTIGIFGGVLGLILGLGTSALIGQIPFATESLPSIATYPIDFNPKFYIIGAIFSIITTYLAGYFPSRRRVVLIQLTSFEENNMSDKVIEAKNISKSFYDPITVQILKDVSFDISKGDFVSIMGKSGCGKSTLLYILSTMDTSFQGDLLIDGESMLNRKDEELAFVRNQKIGFVFQFHYLLTEFSVLDNVMLPGLKLGLKTKEEIEHDAYEKLRILGIEKEALKRANQISGGQKQRVAIARALINDPLIIMGDEPTGNLDKKNGEVVFSIFKELAEEYNQSLLIVTHDPDFASRTHRTIVMEDGRIIDLGL